MKWDCDARFKRKLEWHTWFAWHPVKIAPGDCRWLETILRRRTLPENYLDDYDWEYRAVGEAK